MSDDNQWRTPGGDAQQPGQGRSEDHDQHAAHDSGRQQAPYPAQQAPSGQPEARYEQHGQQQYQYGQQQNPYGQQQNPYAQQQNPYGQQQNPYGQQQNPYGQQNPSAPQHNPYAQSQNPYAPRNPYAPAQPGYTYAGSYQPYGQARKTNLLAILSIVFGLATLPFFFLAILLGPAGAILGHLALGKIRQSNEGGRGLALTGIIAGWVMTGVWIIVVVFWALFLGAHSYTDYSDYGSSGA